MLWFALGTQANIRRGNDILRWLQKGLPLIGPRTTLRWLGSSAVELHIAEPNDPFRDATVLAVLEPRDVALLWAFARSRGRRDFLILRANLRRMPSYEARVRDRRGWTGRDARSDEDRGPGWRTLDWSEPEVEAAVSDPAAAATLHEHWRRLSRMSGGLWRVSVSQTVPHLAVHLRPAPDQVPAEQLLREFRQLALDVLPRR